MTLIRRRLETDIGTFTNFVNILGLGTALNQNIDTGTRTSSLPKEIVLISVILGEEVH